MCLGNSVNEHNKRKFLCGGNFICWNCRGIKNKQEELQILIKDLRPLALLIQESKLKENHTFILKNYTFEHKSQTINEDENTKGGVGIFIRKEIPYKTINITSNLQVVAVQLYIHKKSLSVLFIFPQNKISIKPI